MTRNILLSAGLTIFLVVFTAGNVPASDNEALARQLLGSQGCKGCHLFEGSGGSLGPALDEVGKRMTQEDITDKLRNPKGTNANSMMPAFTHLKPEEMTALSEFLATRK
ncbi:MAG: hypothetical protein C0616_05340 [Desulfuromonas sp.]|nr:MAG: hypothetical protein C0616_05340 [Desulfuromonas sp.]